MKWRNESNSLLNWGNGNVLRGFFLIYFLISWIEKLTQFFSNEISSLASFMSCHSILHFYLLSLWMYLLRCMNFSLLYQGKRWFCMLFGMRFNVSLFFSLSPLSLTYSSFCSLHALTRKNLALVLLLKIFRARERGCILNAVLEGGNKEVSQYFIWEVLLSWVEKICKTIKYTQPSIIFRWIVRLTWFLIHITLLFSTP